MYLENFGVINFRSCKLLDLKFPKDDPAIFIGINDSGKSSILKAVGLLLSDKPSYNSISDSSSKKDFSNSPLTIKEFVNYLNYKKLPSLNYTENQTVLIGKFIIEDNDIDFENLSNYSNNLLWSINKCGNELWLVKLFEQNTTTVQSYILTEDSDDEAYNELWNKSLTNLNRLINDLKITDDEIENVNKAGPFTNLEKIKAIYNRFDLNKVWRPYKIERGDKNFFPKFRYLDWNCSLEDIKNTASDALATQIEAHLKPLRTQASVTATEVEEEVNKELKTLKDSIGDMLPNIKEIKTKIFINIKESVTDILVNKENSDGDVHLDLQGEGVKRQIWFALIKSGALSSIKSGMTNKKFIWAFDEPESHLFPSAQRQFFEIIKEVSKSNVQTIISTHSTVFIDKSKLNTIKSVSLTKDSYSEFNQCDCVDDIFESLEIKNSDFLFFDKFLVIEGDTESFLIPHLYKLYKNRSFEDENVQLINLTGKNKWIENKKALENVLNGFKKSMDYVVFLFDNDMKTELGQAQITDKMFFVGIQDIEDSIKNETWISFVKEITEDKVIFSNEELQSIKDEIPRENNVPKNAKFYSQLERKVKEKLEEIEGEAPNWTVLPGKGSNISSILMKYIGSIEDVGAEVKQAFDKLQNE
ncbi:MAG: AAA family ATPase [Ignavibacteriae bacterium]|nr:AAA family ATPase [Ignavibacteriota bacterium]